MAQWSAHCVWLSFFIAATTAGVALGAPVTPSACNIDGELTSTTPKVLYDGNASFVEKGVPYPVHVYSLYDVLPWTNNFICLRYELQNVGNTPIPLVFWNLIDKWNAFDLAPHGQEHDRLKTSVRRPSASKRAVEGATTIDAFRSEEISTIAWIRVEDWKAPDAKKAEMWETPSYLHVQRSAMLDFGGEESCRGPSNPGCRSRSD